MALLCGAGVGLSFVKNCFSLPGTVVYVKSAIQLVSYHLNVVTLRVGQCLVWLTLAMSRGAFVPQIFQKMTARRRLHCVVRLRIDLPSSICHI